MIYLKKPKTQSGKLQDLVDDGEHCTLQQGSQARELAQMHRQLQKSQAYELRP